MGKTANGALWLSAEKTSPFEFYQYWRNVGDLDVEKCLKMLTFLPMNEIRKLASLEGAEINRAKEILAFEVTKLVHGEEAAAKAQKGARAAFSGGSGTDNIPEKNFPKEEFSGEGKGLLTLLKELELASSNGEARRNYEIGRASCRERV